MTDQVVPGVVFSPSRHGGKGDINQAGRDVVQHIYPGPAASSPVPRQLPPGASGFVGRADQLTRLDTLLSPDSTANRAAAVVGSAGVGKTSVALHWAHRSRDAFPDGDLYVNLRGYDPEGPADPSDVLDGFLRAFDIPPERVPLDPAGREGMYRAVLASRRMLIVLDNAGTAAQVRPLLPGSGTCAVLITSRSRLTGLSIRDGVTGVDLGLLPPHEAALLLTQLIGRRAMDDPEGTVELARMCAHLPLALRIVAERARTRPWTPLRDIVAELRADRDRLDLLSAEDDDLTSVRAVFSWSYRALPPAAAEMFQLLGLHAGPDIQTAAAAALADCPVAEARRRLDNLFSVHLVDSLERDRYHLHDLLQVYAAERCRADMPVAAAAAQRRELTWYLHTANNADLLLNPHRRHVIEGGAEPGPAANEFTTRDEALSWCEADRLTSLAMVRRAAESGAPDLAWKLALALNTFYHVRWYVSDWLETAEIGVASARTLRDPFALAWSLSGLGGAHEMTRNWSRTLECYEEAMRLWRECGDRRGELLGLHNLGNMYREVGRLEDSLTFETEALTVADELGNRKLAGAALRGLGQTHQALGRIEDAVRCFEQALGRHREAEDSHTEGYTLCFLADAYLETGRDADALTAYREALRVHQSISDQRGQGDTLTALGAAELRWNHPAEAAIAWRAAQQIYAVLNEPALGNHVGDLLRALGPA